MGVIKAEQNNTCLKQYWKYISYIGNLPYDTQAEMGIVSYEKFKNMPNKTQFLDKYRRMLSNTFNN